MSNKLKNFTIKLISCLIPIKKYRRKFRSYFSEIDRDINDIRQDIIKYRAICRCIDNIENLILGSSHARDGFIPEDNDFNLALSSQDLYHMYKIYQWCMSHGGDKIKRIIIFFDVFHSGLQLEKTGQNWKCIPYKLLYNIDYAFPISRACKNLEKRWIRQLSDFTEIPDITYRGISSFEVDLNKGKVDILVEKHLKNNQRQNQQILYLEKIFKEAEKRSQEIFIVIPPYSKEYSELLPPTNQVYHELFSILTPNINLLNFRDDNDFDTDDFNDFEHLNFRGAEKLTQKIKKSFNN